MRYAFEKFVLAIEKNCNEEETFIKYAVSHVSKQMSIIRFRALS